MEDKQIEKIVVYKFLERMPDGNMRELVQACMFYNDGTTKQVRVRDDLREYEDFKEYEQQFLNQKNISEKEALATGKIEVMTGNSFTENFNEYVEYAKTQPKQENMTDLYKQLEEVPDEEMNNAINEENNNEVEENKVIWYMPIIAKIKSNKKIAALCTIGAITATMVFSTIAGNILKLTRKSKTGNYSIEKTMAADNTDINNKDYSKMTFEELLEATKDQDVKTMQFGTMTNLFHYNVEIATKHLEEGKTSRLALTYDEVIAQYLAYNADTLTDEQIIRLLDNYKLDADELKTLFKSARRQESLAATVSVDPIDKASIINSQEGKDFYNKYDKLRIAILNAKTEEEIKTASAEFHKELRADFPQMNPDYVEVGAMHDNYEIKSYQLSILGIVTAVETLTKEYDSSLSEKEIEYFNDLGLCNKAGATYDRDANILSSYQINHLNEEHEGPRFSDFRRAAIEELTKLGAYNINDRDITNHEEFKNRVNHFKDGMNVNGVSSSFTTSSSTSRTETTTTNVSREEAVNSVGEDEVRRQEKAANAQFNEENARRKAIAEEEAEKERQKIQEQENEKKKKLEEEIKRREEEYQKRLDEINKNVDGAKEKDFGSGTQIDPGYKDKDGTLTDTIEGVTTDGTNAVDSSTPLPDPNNYSKDSGHIDMPIIEGEVEYKEQSVEEKAEAVVEKMTNQEVSENPKIKQK